MIKYNKYEGLSQSWGSKETSLGEASAGGAGWGMCVTFAYLLEEGRILHNAYPEHTVNKHIM